MIDENFYNDLLDGLKVAQGYKSNGEENKSRVIARQVAGKALKNLMIGSGFVFSPSSSPYQILLIARDHPELFSPILPDLEALTRKVNYDFSFPEDLDLLSSSKKIIEFVKEYKQENAK